MLVISEADLGEMLSGGTELLPMFASGGAEHPGRHRECQVADLGHRFDVFAHRLSTIIVGRGQRARFHLLEAERDGAVGQPTPERLRSKVKRGRPG